LLRQSLTITLDAARQATLIAEIENLETANLLLPPPPPPPPPPQQQLFLTTSGNANARPRAQLASLKSACTEALMEMNFFADALDSAPMRLSRLDQDAVKEAHLLAISTCEILNQIMHQYLL
jgi:hypothetical protein